MNALFSYEKYPLTLKFTGRPLNNEVESDLMTASAQRPLISYAFEDTEELCTSPK